MPRNVHGSSKAFNSPEESFAENVAEDEKFESRRNVGIDPVFTQEL